MSLSPAYLLVTAEHTGEPPIRSPLMEGADKTDWAEIGTDLIVNSDCDYIFSIYWRDVIERYGKFSRLYINDQCFKRTQNGVEVYENSAECIKVKIRRPFHQHFGYVRISIVMQCEHQTLIRRSHYFEVFIPDDDNARNLQAMSEFVYQNQYELLSSDEVSRNMLKLKGTTDLGDINEQLSLLEKILAVYRKNLPFFQSSAKFKLDTVQVPGAIEKMRQMSGAALQYILTHPDELTCDAAGPILWQGSRFSPRKTLIDDPHRNTDIYENRYILSFLKFLYECVNSVVSELDDLPDCLSFKEINGYVSSAKALTGSLLLSCRREKLSLIELQQEIEQLYHRYRQCLMTPDVSVTSPALATPIFMNVPAYREIFDLALAWFDQDGERFKNTAFRLSLLRKSELYEHYVLLKLIQGLREGNDCTLVKAYHHPYDEHEDSDHRAPYNNIFVFNKGPNKVTLFFQPRVQGTNYSPDNPVGLIRNSTLPLIGETEPNNVCFTPDYVLKHEHDDGTSHYIISDAKYSNMSNVIRDQFYELVFKYLYAITPVNAGDCIKSLDIYCGLKDPNPPSIRSTLDVINVGDKPPLNFYQLL